MNYRTLGDAGVKLSEIGLGGWLTFGNALEEQQARSIMNKAFDVGINFFDTANAYAHGQCEESWGHLLKDRRRDSLVLATKVFFPMGDGPNDRGLSRKHIMEQCRASLKRLQTDYVDLYQCHRYAVPGTADAVPLEETIRAMDDLIHQGKILYWGFSEWPADKIAEALQICERGGYYKPKSSQPQYSAVHRNIEKDVLPLCEKAGIGQVVWSPLAQGVLTGKYKPNQPAPADSRATDSRQNQFITKLVENQDLLQKVQRLQPLANEHHCSLAQLALAWCLRQKGVTSCIIGATKPQQVEENAEASGIQFSPDVFAKMEGILA
jgi:voltage-dependent potassium channel beta subunit